MVDPDEIDEDAPILAIAGAAELAGMHPQTLRQYDRLGLVVPARTQGGSRRYSLRHVAQLREVARMSAEGMSLPAIARILELENRVRELHLRVRDLEDRMKSELERRPGARVFAAGATGSRAVGAYSFTAMHVQHLLGQRYNVASVSQGREPERSVLFYRV